jgi:hypothetical protein
LVAPAERPYSGFNVVPRAHAVHREIEPPPDDRIATGMIRQETCSVRSRMAASVAMSCVVRCSEPASGALSQVSRPPELQPLFLRRPKPSGCLVLIFGEGHARYSTSTSWRTSAVAPYRLPCSRRLTAPAVNSPAI